MNLQNLAKTLIGLIGVLGVFVGALYAISGFGHRELRVEDGIRHQILHLGNGTDPEDLDPQITTGVQEDNIMRALLEGLVAEDKDDLHPVPGQAERWDISDDGRVYTFYLRDNARWSNGDPVTAEDFVLSYERALSAKLASQYAHMLFYVVNAKEFYEGTIDDFAEVGFEALDERTLRITLVNPTPFFLSLLNHHSWYPVHMPTVLKHGGFDERGNTWTRAGNYVGNGPFVLEEWKVNHIVIVRKNPLYWDAEQVRLNKIYFYPIEALDVEERAYRAGQIHKTDKLPLSKIQKYQEQHEEGLVITPYLGTYFYMLNTSLEALKDRRVRRALSMSLDRDAIVKTVSRGGEFPAYHFVPPDTAGYMSRARIQFDVRTAQRLLAEAGYPNGQGFPKLNILYNTLESHKAIAEAIQQMWKRALNIEVTLENQEWKVFLNSKSQGDYQMVRFGWIADYVDPNAFLDLWISDNGNNTSGWSHPEYDRLIALAAQTPDQEARYEVMQQAEALLLDEMPILPIYFYMTTSLVHPSLRNWNPTILDHQPYKHVYLDSEWRKTE